MSKKAFTAQLRDFDDAGLDPYQFRLLMHYWRVGVCWETVRTTAEKCNMSIGKVSQSKQELIDRGLIEYTLSKKGKVAVKLCSSHEQRSQHDEQRSRHEQTQQDNVHHMNAILNEPNILNEPLLNGDNDIPESTPLPTLMRHFTELTSFFPPGDSTPNFESKWQRPLLSILEKASGDTEGAKGAITKAVKLLRDKKYSISSPYSIQTTAVNILSGVSGNGNGGNYLPLWKPIEAEIRSNGRRSTKKWDEKTTKVLRRAGGFPALCNMSFIDAERAFSAAYKDTT